MKTKSLTKPLFLAILIVLGMIVSPVCALGYTITAEPIGVTLWEMGRLTNLTYDVSSKGDAIQRVSIDIPTGTTVNFTLWYGSGSTVSGWMVYRNSTDCADLIFFYDAFCQYSAVSIGGDDQGYTYRGIEEMGRVDIIGYARNYITNTNYTTGFIVYDSVLGISEREIMSYYPVSNVSGNVIYKIQLNMNNPSDVWVYQNSRDKVAAAAGLTPGEAGNDWVAIALKYAGSAVGFIAGLFWILKFFFIDNLLLIIAIWISVTMAVSAVTTPMRKMPWGFFEKFFRYQRALLDFIVSLWTTLWSTINYLVQIFVKWL